MAPRPRTTPRPRRESVDLSAYPDLIVIYLGMKAHTLRAVATILGYGPRIQRSVDADPDGLLRHELIFYSLNPARIHIGMRQYWRDFDALERWARTDPHAQWWRALQADTTGTGFWHEAYFARGGMEALYLDVPQGYGLKAFAPVSEARGSMFSARRRLRLPGQDTTAPPVAEDDFYDEGRAS
ncbi:MAG TPA: phenylacetaldoxime dehydratase family protein [Mycobacteriales bacterium]|nr:phenylacetaldoxime dehydratase family protein [Mycobacteriales bacterium]